MAKPNSVRYQRFSESWIKTKLAYLEVGDLTKHLAIRLLFHKRPTREMRQEFGVDYSIRYVALQLVLEVENLDRLSRKTFRTKRAQNALEALKKRIVLLDRCRGKGLLLTALARRFVPELGTLQFTTIYDEPLDLLYSDESHAKETDIL